MDNDESAIGAFFDALLEDKTEKRILTMLRQGLEPDKILERLLEEEEGG